MTMTKSNTFHGIVKYLKFNATNFITHSIVKLKQTKCDYLLPSMILTLTSRQRNYWRFQEHDRKFCFDCDVPYTYKSCSTECRPWWKYRIFDWWLNRRRILLQGTKKTTKIDSWKGETMGRTRGLGRALVGFLFPIFFIAL